MVYIYNLGYMAYIAYKEKDSKPSGDGSYCKELKRLQPSSSR